MQELVVVVFLTVYLKGQLIFAVSLLTFGLLIGRYTSDQPASNDLVYFVINEAHPELVTVP